MDVKEAVEIKESLRNEFFVGNWVVDSEGNEFKITEFVINNDPFMWDHINLWSRRGESVIGSGDLRYFIKRG